MSIETFMEHMRYETKIPNIIAYTLFMIILVLTFAMILSRDMDEREAKLAAGHEEDVGEERSGEDEECFSEEQTRKLEAHNKEIPTARQLPDVYLLVRVSYGEAEKLLTSGKDVRFVSFGDTEVVIQKNSLRQEEEEVEPPEDESPTKERRKSV